MTTQPDVFDGLADFLRKGVEFVKSLDDKFKEPAEKKADGSAGSALGVSVLEEVQLLRSAMCKIFVATAKGKIGSYTDQEKAAMERAYEGIGKAFAEFEEAK